MKKTNVSDLMTVYDRSTGGGRNNPSPEGPRGESRCNKEDAMGGSCRQRVACAESRALRELYYLLWARLGLGKSVGK